MKRLLTAFTILLAILLSLFLYQIYKPENPLTADLASPSQEKRDVAAKALRSATKPPSKIKWILRTTFIRKDEPKEKVFEWLRFYNVSTNPVWGMGGLGESAEYQLDDYWRLGCDYENGDVERRLIRWKLLSGWRIVAVWPTTNYTGLWINYYANGQKYTESCYTNENRCGEFITYYPNGLKSSVWHYDNWKANGLCTQYFPSGQILYQGQYSNNVRVGNGVWYNEDGSTNHISNYSKP